MLRPSRLAPVVAGIVVVFLLGSGWLAGQSRYVGYDTGPRVLAASVTGSATAANTEEAFRAGTVELLR